MEEIKNHSAKFAFFYLLSLVALLFMAISTGTVIFQIINKYIADFAASYPHRYSSGALKFAISSLVVSVPIFYLTTAQIQKNLFRGKLDPESGIRRWLTYFIMFVASVVMIVWVIVTINSFLSGELTLRFGLKFLTVLVIAGSIFGYYFYDIKREGIKETKDLVIKYSFWISLVAVMAVCLAGLFIVESPWETRKKNLDREVLNNLSAIERGVQNYYEKENSLPQDLKELQEVSIYIKDMDLTDPETGEKYEYQVLDRGKYELCANFRTSNLEDEENFYRNEKWPHKAGEKCFELEAQIKEEAPEPDSPEPTAESR